MAHKVKEITINSTLLIDEDCLVDAVIEEFNNWLHSKGWMATTKIEVKEGGTTRLPGLNIMISNELKIEGGVIKEVTITNTGNGFDQKIYERELKAGKSIEEAYLLAKGIK